MPRIEILASPLGPAASVDADGRLLDICDDAGAPVGFSCRSARCCTCRVDVIEGADLLDPPGEDELTVLRLRASRPNQRLACQAVVRPGPGLVRIRWVGAQPASE
ncbi:MAG: 2Fe-2S iron-sulfur cluster-binding protein [Minicystis sp.]